MRRFKLLLLALFCMISLTMNAQTENIVRILAIGNSFSQDAVEQYLHEIAAADGQKVIIGNMYIGGCSLAKHLKNAKENLPAYKYRKIGLDGIKVETIEFTLEQALADEQWDYVSVQQQSGQSGLYDTWMESLPELLEYLRARLPEQVTFMIHQTWAYDQTSTHKQFKNYNHDQMAMYNAIMKAVQKVSKQTGIKMVIPAGTAVQNARTTILKDEITRDGFHMHKVNGRYVVACTWYEKIFRKDVVGNAFIPKGMSQEQQLAAQKSAHAAVQKPFKVTEIK